MSDEKIDRIDRRVNELVTITGNLVTAVTGLTTQVGEITTQVTGLTTQVGEITTQVTGLTTQVSGLATQVSGLATQVTEITAHVKENTEQIKVHSEQINRLIESQQIMSGQIADIARVVIKTDKRLENLEQKVDEGFEEFRKEFRIVNRKIDWTANTSLDAHTRVEDLENRVAQIEQKIAV